MTFQEFAEKFLEERGMFPNQAEQVIQHVKANHPEMELRWSDNVSGYPPVMQDVIATTLQSEGLAWIDRNLPMAWYRPMFVFAEVETA